MCHIHCNKIIFIDCTFSKNHAVLGYERRLSTVGDIVVP